MGQLRGIEIQQIIQLFENEMSMLPKVGRTDKMKLRRKISNALVPTLNHPKVTVDMVTGRVQNKLDDVVALFIDRNQFMTRLNQLLREFLP
jgi:hypothetical protein